MPNSNGAVDLGSLSPEEQESLSRMAEESPDSPEEKPKVLTAFAIVVDFDGNPSVVTYEHDDFVIQSPPTPDFVYASCSTVIKDLQAQETAQAAAHATAQLMMQQARAMAEAQAQQQIAAGLNLGKR